MLSNNETNSNVVEIQQLQQQNNSTPSPEGSLEQKIESLGKEIKSLRKQNRLNSGIIGLGVIGFIGYIVATNWLAIAPAAPVIGIAIGAIIGAAVLVGASYAIWKYRAQIKEGFKYAAEKTVEGAKHIGGKIKDGAVHAKDSVKEAVSFVGQATREGTSSALRAMGGGVQKFGRKISNGGASMSNLDAIPYSIDDEGQTVVLKTEEKTRNFNSVKEMFVKEVFEDKAVNSSALTKEIFSKLGEKILEKAYSVDGQQSAKKDQLINRLKQQIDFVSKLSDKKLQNLLAQNDNNLYQIFSEHHNEIKKVIGECKTEHKLSSVVEKLNGVAKRHGESRRGSMLSNSLPRSNSLDSARTDSTVSSEAELLNPAEHKEVKAPSSFWDKVSSLFKSGKKSGKTSEVEYQALESGAVPPATVNPNRLSRSSSFSGYDSPKLTPVDPLKLSRSSSTDSGFNSPTSSPVRIMFTNEDGKVKTQADLRKTVSLENLVKPSSKVDEVKPESTQVKTVG